MQSTKYASRQSRAARRSMSGALRYRLAVLSDLYFRPTSVDEYGRLRTEPQNATDTDGSTSSTSEDPSKRVNADATAVLSKHQQLEEKALTRYRIFMQRFLEEFAHPYERLEHDVCR